MLSIVKGIEPRDQVEAPFGAPPPAPWKRHTVQPRTAGSDHWFDGGAPPQLPFDLRCEPALLA
jgi:hypothetical protein